MNKYLFKFRLFGIPVKADWSVLFILVYAIPFSRSFADYPLCVFSYFCLIVIHELGHAALVKFFRYEILEINVVFNGGSCVSSGPDYEFEYAVISWGGVLAQFIALFAALAMIFYSQYIPSNISGMLEVPLLSVFVFLNILMIIINLVPYRDMDGVYAWRVFRNIAAGKIKTAVRSHPDNSIRNNYLDGKEKVNALFESMKGKTK